MSINNYETALKGNCNEAEAAAEAILLKMSAYAKKGGATYQLKFSLSMLSQICQAIVAGGTNYAIYCDIFDRILAPNIKPESSAKYWNSYLEMVRYFCYLLVKKKRFAELQQVFRGLARQSQKLQNENDWEFILGIYYHHLTAQLFAGNEPKGEDVANSHEVYSTIGALFEEMLQKNAELNFVYKNLVTDCMQCLIPNKASAICKYIGSSSHKSAMFDAFFKLLAGLHTPQVSADEAHSCFMQYMEAFLLFLKIDIASPSSLADDQIALKFLRACRNLKVIHTDKAMAYVMSMLYYFVKFVTARSADDNFVQTYIDFCDKFKSLVKKSGDALKQEKWFMDFIVAMSLVVSQIEDTANISTFQTFQQEMQKSELVYAAHLSLILELIKMAPAITSTKLTSFKCCTSTRKHISIGIVQTVLNTYINYVGSEVPNKIGSSVENKLHEMVGTIINHGIVVFDTMKCITQSSPDIIAFSSRFYHLLSKITSSLQAKLCLSLTEALIKIHNKFTPQVWCPLLRRLRRAIAVTKDSELLTEIYAIQIGWQLKMEHQNSSYVNQIGVFYGTGGILSNMCLLEILEQSKSVLKPMLEAKEKQLLYTAESQVIFKYHKTNVTLHASLLRCSRTHLDYVLIARQSKQLKTHDKLQRICDTLEWKADKRMSTTSLKRVEELTLAHVYTAIACKKNEEFKGMFDCEIVDCVEENLEKLLLRQEIRCIDVISETIVIDIILKALHLFENFYNKADLEPISSDEVLIDWEAILDDVSFLARLLQLHGYIENASQAWLLLYRMANMLDDSNNVLRSLAFLCEHAVYLQAAGINFNFKQEINSKENTILNSLHDLQNATPRCQNYVLLCLSQIAFYYARLGNLSYAQMLLELVACKRNELLERSGKFDFVLCTLEAIKFRIRWKFTHTKMSMDTECLLREADDVLNRFRGIVYITSEDSWNYVTLLFELMHEMIECTVNRLCDNIFNVMMSSVLRVALEMCSALRVVQILTMWALANLQMEFVDKAQTKLMIIEYFLRTKNVHELAKIKASLPCAVQDVLKHAAQNIDNELFLHVNPGMEAMRKVAQVPLSPIMKDKLSLTVAPDNIDLQRFLKHDAYEVTAKSNILQWTYITVGCVNARLLFLIEEYAQLEDFYENCQQWCKSQTNGFLKTTFQNFQLTSMQHYVNYLRVHKKYTKALNFIEVALNYCKEVEGNVDIVYKMNLELQKRATKCEFESPTAHKEAADVNFEKLRRALVFQYSPEDETNKQSARLKPLKIDSNTKSTKNASPVTTNTSFIAYDSDENDSEDIEINTVTNSSRQLNVLNQNIALIDFDSDDDCNSNSIKHTNSEKSNNLSGSKSTVTNKENIEVINLDNYSKSEQLDSKIKSKMGPKSKTKIAPKSSSKSSKPKNPTKTELNPTACSSSSSYQYNKKHTNVANEIIKKMQFLDLDEKTTSSLSSANVFIIEDSPEKSQATTTCQLKAGAKSSSSTTEAVAKKRGRPKKLAPEAVAKTDAQIVEKKRTTRQRRQLT